MSPFLLAPEERFEGPQCHRLRHLNAREADATPPSHPFLPQGPLREQPPPNPPQAILQAILVTQMSFWGPTGAVLLQVSG